ncbi:MAG: ABC transporter permease, partial [Acetobacteraceae bacterium]
MMLALRLARRELRGGVRGLWTVLLCLALGVALIAAVGELRAATDAGLAANGRQILGGDLEIGTGAQPPPPALVSWLEARGARVSQWVVMRSLLVAPSGDRQLVALRAVDDGWPLVGSPVIDPAQTVADAIGKRDGRWGVLADPVALGRLKLKPGDTARLGEESFAVRGALVSSPDRVGGPVLLGSPAVIDVRALPATGLVVPGSLVQHELRVMLADPADAPALATALQAAFSNEGWRVRLPKDAAPGVGRFIDRASVFLTLVGLTSLLVGGIGVANGVRAWLDARVRTIATLRCLGASAPLMFAVYMIQVMVLSAAGIAVGLVVGVMLPLLMMHWLQGLLPVPAVPGVYRAPLVLAAAYGALTALVFATWPLGRAARIPGGALFRDALLPERAVPTRAIVAAEIVCAAALIILTVVTTSDHGFALWFCAAAVVTLVLFRIGGAGVMRAARAIRVRQPSAKLGVANLHRPGTTTPLMLVSVGIGLSTLAAVALIQG